MRLQQARALCDSGRFTDALALLVADSHPVSERLEAEVLKIGLLQRLGDYTKGRYLAEKALRSRSLPPQFQADCNATIAHMDAEDGRVDRAIERYQKALQFARQAKDPHRASWIQLRLMLASCGLLPPETSGPIIAATRVEVRRLGDARALAALHLFVGQVAAKHGASGMARRHTRIGLTLLESAPNAWLRAFGENTLLALSIMTCDIEAGLKHAHAGLQAAQMSGAASVKRALVGNLGNLYSLEGSWDEARQHFRENTSGHQATIEAEHGTLESLARLHLLEDDLDSARTLLDTIDAAERTDSDAAFYVHRHSKLTRALLHIQEQRFDDALRQIDVVRELANRSGDHILYILADLTHAETLALQGRHTEFGVLIDRLRPAITGLPIDLLGQYERILGSALAPSDTNAGLAHFSRAARVFEALRHRPGQIQLQRASLAAGVELRHWQPIAQPDPMQAAHGARVVHDILTMLLHVGRPELLAADVVEVLAATACVTRAAAVARHDDGRVETLAAHARPMSHSPATALPDRTYRLGRAGTRTIEVTCEPLHHVEAIATVNAIASVLEVIRDLEIARNDREERLGLWPVEELPDTEDDAMIAGAMREVMRIVRRVATTSATILITGESGTGKEIVARALHRFSRGSSWPFVPFNCTAVPRDLLESHLFGHRRGAFTGAERDHPGVIRTAKDGTLFLDEIGELSLELQPKLLRFLESNEVTPLGESEPVHVKTRVVAATNANLDALVQDGKFRADLFYRLRVVPIHIPPLRDRRDEIPGLARYFVAKAAAADDKGHLELADDAVELLTLYAWPGNVRQLSNEIRRIVALADNDAKLTIDMLAPEIRRGRAGAGGNPGPGSSDRPTSPSGDDGATIAFDSTLATATARLEREMIAAALRKHSGRLDDAAKVLGLSRKGLYLKRVRLGL